MSIFVVVGRSTILISQNMIPLSCNRPLYLFANKYRFIPWEALNIVLQAMEQTLMGCGSCLPDPGHASWLRPQVGRQGCLWPPPQRPTCPIYCAGCWETCCSGQQRRDDLLFFFITDELKDDSIKKDRPCKIFFKDLFLFKENEMAAKKKVRFN